MLYFHTVYLVWCTVSIYTMACFMGTCIVQIYWCCVGHKKFGVRQPQCWLILVAVTSKGWDSDSWWWGFLALPPGNKRRWWLANECVAHAWSPTLHWRDILPSEGQWAETWTENHSHADTGTGLDLSPTQWDDGVHHRTSETLISQIWYLWSEWSCLTTI